MWSFSIGVMKLYLKVCVVLQHLKTVRTPLELHGHLLAFSKGCFILIVCQMKEIMKIIKMIVWSSIWHFVQNTDKQETLIFWDEWKLWRFPVNLKMIPSLFSLCTCCKKICNLVTSDNFVIVTLLTLVQFYCLVVRKQTINKQKTY